MSTVSVLSLRKEQRYTVDTDTVERHMKKPTQAIENLIFLNSYRTRPHNIYEFWDEGVMETPPPHTNLD